MFRIDRSFVHLASRRSVQVESEGMEAVATGNSYPDAAASAAQIAQTEKAAQDIINAAMAEAEKIIDDARYEVAALMVSSREQAEEERRLAWQEGYEGGTIEGKRSYDSQLAGKLREDDESLKRVIGELYDERARTYSGLEDEVVTLALEIVRKVVNPTEEEYEKSFESLIKNALRQMSPDGRIIIRVGPADYERFFSSGSAVLELESGETVAASVLRDISLGDSDCIIDTDDATVNAGLDSQLKYIRVAFEKLKIEN